MRLPRVRFTMRRMAAVIAGCALYLAVLREAPLVVIVFHLLGFPVAGSLLELRKGGKGLTGGLIGGTIGSLSVALGLAPWPIRTAISRNWILCIPSAWPLT
jgi:hypothetical protein